VYNNARNSAYLGGDGVELCATTHPTLTGNQSNLGTAAALSETAIEQAIIDIADYKDERGILISAQALSLHIPPALMFTAAKIFDSTLSTTLYNVTSVGATSRNDINAVRSKGILPRGYHINHRFSSTTAWYIRTDVTNGLKHFVRVPLKTGSEGDFDTGNFRYKARERYSFGWSDWRAIYGNAGA